ncbi:MAG TPA: MFS transporter [Chitinophagaceae bacterium]|nr:MFS transporter [Chitinophagaceae bacterium]
MNNKIRLKEKIGYGLGDAASSMFWKIFGMYALFFYTDVLGITAAAAGTMFLVARVWDSLFDVLVGIIADRTKTKWGQYRPYLLWFAVPFSVMGVITFFVPEFGNTGKLIYAYITYSTMMLIYSLINVPYASLLGVLSENSQERNILASYRMTFAFIGSFITFMLLQPLVDLFSKLLNHEVNSVAGNFSISTTPVGWTLAVASIGVLCTILFFLCFKWTRERVQPALQQNAEKKGQIKRDLKTLLLNTPWWILVGTGLAALLFNAVRDGVAIYYFRDYVRFDYNMPITNWDITTIYFLIGQAANIIGVVLAPKLSEKYGKKNTFLIAVLSAGVFSIVFYFIPNNITWIMLFQTIISICAGYVLPLLWSMFADIVDYHELTTGRRTSGLIFSSSSMSQKLGWALGSALTGWVLFLFSYDHDLIQQSAKTILGERLMISILPAACCLLAFIGMLFYPLTEKRVDQIGEQLNRQRKKQ